MLLDPSGLVSRGAVPHLEQELSIGNLLLSRDVLHQCTDVVHLLLTGSPFVRIQGFNVEVK